MSDDVNKDIQKAVQDAKALNGKGKKDGGVNIPPPKMLQHGLNLTDSVIIPSPKTVIAEIEKDKK